MRGLMVAAAMWAALLTFYSFGRWDGRRRSRPCPQPTPARPRAADPWAKVLRSLGIAILVAGATGLLTAPISTQPLFFVDEISTQQAQDTQIWIGVVFLVLTLAGATAIMFGSMSGEYRDELSLLRVGVVVLLVTATLFFVSRYNPILAATGSDQSDAVPATGGTGSMW